MALGRSYPVLTFLSPRGESSMMNRGVVSGPGYTFELGKEKR